MSTQDHVRLRVERLLAAAATIAGHEHPQRATRHAGLRAAWRELAAACAAPVGGAQEGAAPGVPVPGQRQAAAELQGGMDATDDDLTLGAAITATLRQGQAAANGGLHPGQAAANVGLQQPPGPMAPHVSVASTPGAAQQPDPVTAQQPDPVTAQHEQPDVMEEEEEILYQPGQPQRAPQQQPPEWLPHQDAAGTGLPSSGAPLQLQQPQWQYQGQAPEHQSQQQAHQHAPGQQPQANGDGAVQHAPGQQPPRLEAGFAEAPVEVTSSVGLLRRPAAQQQWQANQAAGGTGVPFSLGLLQQPHGQQQAQWLPQQQAGGLPGSAPAVLLQQAPAQASSTPPVAALMVPPPPQGLHSPQQQQSGQVQLLQQGPPLVSGAPQLLQHGPPLVSGAPQPLQHGPPLVSGAQQGWMSGPVGMPQAQLPQQQQPWQAGPYSGAMPEVPQQQASAGPSGVGQPQGPPQQHPQLQQQQGQGMQHFWGGLQGSLFDGRQAPASLVLQLQQQQDRQRLFGGNAGPPAQNGNGGFLGHDLFAGYRQSGGVAAITPISTDPCTNAAASPLLSSPVMHAATAARFPLLSDYSPLAQDLRW